MSVLKDNSFIVAMIALFLNPTPTPPAKLYSKNYTMI